MKYSSLVCSLLLGLAAVTRVNSADPSLSLESASYRGKPVLYWVGALETDQSLSSKSRQAEAEEAIHALGPDAIPAILTFQGRDRNQRLQLIGHACAILQPEGEGKLIEALSDPNPLVRQTALEILPKSAVTGALPDLVRLGTDPVRTVRAAAVLALVRLAPEREETVAALVDVLHDLSAAPATQEPRVSREEAAALLGTLGAKAATPALTEALGDSDDEVREAAAVALWKIDRSVQGVGVLTERLENAREYQTWVRVARILGEMGPQAKAAVPVLRKKIENPEVPFVPAGVDLAQVGLQVLGKIDPAASAELRKKQSSPSSR